MAKLKSERIVVYYKDRYGHDDRKEDPALDFKADINVTQSGTFTCTLPKDVVDTLVAAGIDLNTNSRRGSRQGFFESGSLDGLLTEVRTVCADLVKKKLLSEKIVIRYTIETGCKYIIEDGEFFPNGRFAKVWEGQFRDGTIAGHATNPVTFGFRVWTECVWKRDYEFANGKKKTFFHKISEAPEDEESQPMLHWLSGVVCNDEAIGEVMEIEYNEDTAAFFVSIYKAIFSINERVKEFIQPEAIMKLIESKAKLLS